LAILGLADQIKSSSLATVQELQKQGKEVVIISGDHEDVVKHVAVEMGITRYYAQIKPTEKADLVKKISGKQTVDHCSDGCCLPVSTKKEDNYVVMVGDGINDAPALAQSDIGIAMSTGTDIAIESADLTLLHGDISKILKAITISKLTHSAIIQNLCWAFSYNIIGIPLAAGAFYPVFGWLLNPAFEGAAMAMSDLTVIGNSIRLQNKKI
jgi:P-type Cu+ transporter